MLWEFFAIERQRQARGIMCFRQKSDVLNDRGKEAGMVEEIQEEVSCG